MEGKNTRRKIKRIIVIILGLITIAAAAVALFLAMRPRMPENAVISGVDMSDMLLPDAEMLFEESVNNYTLQVTAGGQVFEITAEELGMVFLKDNFNAAAEALADTGTSMEPGSLFSYDPEKLDACISEKFNEQRVASLSPVIVLDETENAFQVVPGTPETWYSREVLTEAVTEAVAELAATLELSETVLYQERYDSALQESAEELAQTANDLIAQQFEYIFNPRKVELGREVIDRATLASFVRFDLAENIIYADEQAVSAYVESFASNYKYEKYRDRFVTHDGDRIELTLKVSPQSVDKEKLTDLIVECIETGNPGSFEVPYDGALNFEGTYIEVCIPQQRLWYYENGVLLLETDVVTGWEGIGRRTPTGIHYVRGHLTDVKLFSEYPADYWMSFTSGGIYGFHDADHWRDEYGGKIYETNGSSGCVNVPLVNMEKLYNMVADGTPVMIYNYYHYDDI